MVASGSFEVVLRRSALLSLHVGRVAVISLDGHARQPHLRIKRVVQSVGHECFEALANAYAAYVCTFFHSWRGAAFCHLMRILRLRIGIAGPDLVAPVV